MDEALTCLLNTYVRIQFDGEEEGDDEDVRFMKQLLDRGACFWFRQQDERSSSIVALVEWVIFLGSQNHFFPFWEFSSYFCYPLLREDGLVRERLFVSITFDRRRVAPLSCLAARRIPRSEKASEVPQGLRSIIEAHQELKSQLEQ